MIPKLSIFILYGDLSFFRKKLDEGYKEVTFGCGDWVGDERIVAIWAFFGPTDKIATLQFPKGLEPGGCTSVSGGRFQKDFRDLIDFEKYCRKRSIKLEENRAPLEEIIRQAENLN